MSWKGFTKAVGRLPAMISKQTGGIQETRDEEFIQMEQVFKLMDQYARKLSVDAKTFKDSLVQMLAHQTSLSEVFCAIYEPILSSTQEEPQHSIQAVTDFSNAMKNARDTLQGDLEQIERLVVAPTGDLCIILDQIKKMITKRSHKLLDYDRYRESVQSLRDKPTRTSSEEKKLAQLQVQFDQATREYNAINNLLKQDLATFLSLRHAFIDPCLLTFYNYQIRVYQTLYTIFYQVGQAQFDLNTSAMDGYRDHQEKVEQMLANLSITKPIVRVSLDKPPSYQETQDSLAPPASTSMHRASFDQPPKPVPVDPPRLSLDLNPAAKYVIAMYDFEAQAPGDLSFRKDDKIEVLEKRDVNDWWVGRIGGRTGQFPGNYVREI